MRLGGSSCWRATTLGLFLAAAGCGDDPTEGGADAGAPLGGEDSGTTPDGGGGGADGGAAGLPGFRVQGRHLYDRCGEKVVLRGINEMVVWSPGRDGDPEYAEIAKTGANVVRIVWNTTDGTSAAELDRAIGNAVAQKLIPMPELHDATGDRTKLATVVDYWVRPDVVEVIRKYEQVVLVNLGNEIGDNTVTAAQFQADYEEAITRMRTAGYRVPLVIDAPTWGQNIDVLQAAGPALVNADPDHNILLSVHMWWSDATGSRVTTELQQSVDANLPLIVGEFAQHAVYLCEQSPFSYQTLMAKAQELEVGWLAWSWGGVKNSDCAASAPFDMTSAGTFDTLTGWGLEVAVSDPNSIQQTSVRPQSMLTGACP